MPDVSAETADSPAPRTAWSRSFGAPARALMHAQSGSAIVLFGATIAALLWANSPWWESYEDVWRTAVEVRLGDWGLELELREVVNQGLMTLFFLVVGLEARRELAMGELRERRRLAVPVFAAFGGALVPVAIFVALNAGGEGSAGWGAALSTDTAFALGALALLAPTAVRLRVFLLTFAVVDDVIALTVIATVYTEAVDVAALIVALVAFVVIYGVRRLPLGMRRPLFWLAFAVLWVAMVESGVDPVIAGLVVGLLIDAHPPVRTDLERVTQLTRLFREQPTPQLARSARLGVLSALSPNERLEGSLQPWVAYAIVPVFALANAGVHLSDGILADALTSPITLGIALGYVVGKPVGVLVATWVVTKLRLGARRLTISWPVLTAGGLATGYGFTVSLLVATIAFEGRALDEARIGVLGAIAGATLTTWAMLRIIRALPEEVRARQIGRTAGIVPDLSDEVDPERDHVRGGASATVTLVEYGDYQCPYCGQAEDVVRELLDAFGEDLRYVWRHLPLNDVHADAQLAAEAAEAAAAQDAFWPMHDALLAHQDELAADDLVRRARELGLDVARFEDDLRDRRHADRVTEDVASADRSGVAGTPTFFVNGRRHQGAYDAATLTQAVRTARSRVLAERAAASASG